MGARSRGTVTARPRACRCRCRRRSLAIGCATLRRALEELPSLAHALDTGELGWSAARELTRVAVADTEQQWLELANGKTLRQLEELVAGKRPGDEPSAAGLSPPTRHVLRFEVAPETLALFREALTALRRRSSFPK